MTTALTFQMDSWNESLGEFVTLLAKVNAPKYRTGPARSSYYGPLLPSAPAEVSQVRRQRDVEQQRMEENTLHPEHTGNLIPGISDDIVVEHILTKLEWRQVKSLSSVSRAMRAAIRERKVYEARVRHNCMKTYLAMARMVDPHANIRYGSLGSQFCISLYNPQKDSWISLPPIPQVHGGIPRTCSCVFVAGRLYVLGGLTLVDNEEDYVPAKDVFVIDLAVEGIWRSCSSMSMGRSDFCCGVIDGKIFVTGGWSSRRNINTEGEVYDPDTDSWSPIAKMPLQRWNQVVGVLEKELFLFGGSISHPSILDFENFTIDFDSCVHESPDWADVYNPQQNQWRREYSICKEHRAQTWLAINGKLLSLVGSAIDIYEECSGSWRTFSHSQDSRILFPEGVVAFHAFAAAHADGEVFALMRWVSSSTAAFEITVLKIKTDISIRGDDVEVEKSPEWEVVKCPYHFDPIFPFLLPVQL